ncbi:hypothetical protein LTR84_007397 [Exophiala bonariae]|uniref:Heterokaryon incompatibility domain-containing protein n=1 Tax=Exophiala bonariae TaxID=1690606 RepID=A0AAV9MYI1_9EURO|nr:hypothetical protein LTR84_007397 [Exophiala bonariae]
MTTTLVVIIATDAWNYSPLRNLYRTICNETRIEVEKDRYGLDDAAYWDAIFRGLFPNTPLPISPYWDSSRPKESFLAPVSESTRYAGGSINLVDVGQRVAAEVSVEVGITAFENLSGPNLAVISQASVVADREPTEAEETAPRISPELQQLVQQESVLAGILSSEYTQDKRSNSATLPPISSVSGHIEQIEVAGVRTKSLVDSGYGSLSLPSILPSTMQSSASKRPTSRTSSDPPTMRSLHSIPPSLPTVDSIPELFEDHLTGFIPEFHSKSRAVDYLTSEDLADKEDSHLHLVMQSRPSFGAFTCRLLDIGSHGEPIELRFKQFEHLDGAEFFIWTAESHQLDDFCEMKISNTGPQGHTVVPSELLPSAFRDVVTMTRNLGCRYLWNNELCSRQGDPGHHSTQIGHAHPLHQCATAIIKANPSFKSHNDSEQSGCQPPRVFSLERDRILGSIGLEPYSITRWLSTSARDDHWIGHFLGASSHERAEAALPLFYYSPSYTTRRCEGLLSAVAARDLRRAQLWVMVDSMSLRSSLDSRRIMQLLKSLRISAVRQKGGTICKPTRLVYQATSSFYIETRPMVPFLRLYDHSKSFEFCTQLRFLQLCFYGSSSSQQTQTTTEQPANQRVTPPSAWRGKPFGTRRDRKQAYRAEREGSESTPQTASVCPQVEDDGRRFRCIYSAAREQGLVDEKDTRDRVDCDKTDVPTVQKFKDYELAHRNCHNWSSTRRKLPKDRLIWDYTEEDTWFRLLLKAFPCYFYNGLSLPSPYTKFYLDFESPHVSRYDPERLGLEEGILKPLLEQIRQAETPVAQPAFAEALYLISSGDCQSLTDETIDPTFLMQNSERKVGLMDEDFDEALSLLSPSTLPNTHFSPHSVTVADVTRSGRPEYEIDHDRLAQDPQSQISFGSYCLDFMDTIGPVEQLSGAQNSPLEAGSEFSMMRSRQSQEISFDSSTIPTSLPSTAPLSVVDLCRCPPTTDVNNTHYHCARRNKCNCTPCGRWILGSIQGNRILAKLEAQVAKSIVVSEKQVDYLNHGNGMTWQK